MSERDYGRARGNLIARAIAVLATAAAPGLLISTSAAAADEGAAPAAGRLVYERWCAACHDPGIEHPGTNALMTKYQGVKSGVILEWNDLSPELVRHLVRTGMSVMPHFRRTEISDPDLDALASYLSRNTKP
jgi:mono/diheme cytochrome c family protein